MVQRSNPRQLVLRRDTATGLTLVGWESDMPVGRFEHLALICETLTNRLPDMTSEAYAAWQAALQQARHENKHMLAQQMHQLQAKGWLPVPFALAGDEAAMQADSVGNFAAAAMRLQYELTQNRKQAWAIIRQDTVVHVRARYPQKPLDTLTYQVWYHQQQQQLNAIGGTVLEGHLLVCESGLWFERT